MICEYQSISLASIYRLARDNKNGDRKRLCIDMAWPPCTYLIYFTRFTLSSLGEQDMLTQFWFTAGPPSATLANIDSMRGAGLAVLIPVEATKKDLSGTEGFHIYLTRQTYI